MFVTIENAMESRKTLREFFEYLGTDEFTSSQYKKSRLEYSAEYGMEIYETPFGEPYPDSRTAPYCLASAVEKGLVIKTGEETFTYKKSVYGYDDETFETIRGARVYYRFLVNVRGYKKTWVEFREGLRNIEKAGAGTRFIYKVNWPKVEEILG